MYALLYIFYILFFHWLFDFVLQSNEQAKNKSSSNKWLMSHALDYSCQWITVLSWTFIIMSWITGLGMSYPLILKVIAFGLITFGFHSITDYFTSRWTKKLWEKKDVHNFFVVIGFDQLLHYIQLFLTSYFIIF